MRNKIINNKISFYGLIVLFSLVMGWENIVYCASFTSVGFDAQYAMLWNYSLASGLIPFKDVFYPYGLLSFYSNWNFYTHLLPIVLYVLILCYYSRIFKKILDNKITALVTSFAFIYFLEHVTGMYLVNRYGVVLAFAFIVVEIFYSKNANKKILFFLGVLNGLIYSLTGDPGIYSVLVFVFAYFFFNIFIYKQKSIIFLIKNSAFLLPLYGFGLFMGALPFFVYLFLTGSFVYYIQFLKDVSILLDSWKAPFTPFLNSPDNIFTFSAFFISGFVLIFKIVRKEKLRLSDFLQGVILLLIVLFEQKSLIKSIDRQITFLAFFLYILLMHELTEVLKKHKIPNILLNVYFILFILFALFRFPFSKIPHLQQYGGAFYAKNINTIHECVDATRQRILKDKAISYSDESLLGFFKNGKSVYSFPGEPLWYIVHEKDFPGYPDTYVASYSKAEQKRIDYIQKNKPEYILYNYAVYGLIDAVPDYVRAGNELKYILGHYEPFKKVGETLVMKKSIGDTDYFNFGLVQDDVSLARNLLNIHFGNIPRSEGIYKSNNVENIEWNKITKNSEVVNLNSKNLLLVMKHKSNIAEFSSISFKTQNQTVTSVEFMNCRDGELCVINLDRIPLFYSPKNIISIEFDLLNHSEYAFVKNNASYGLW